MIASSRAHRRLGSLLAAFALALAAVTCTPAAAEEKTGTSTVHTGSFDEDGIGVEAKEETPGGVVPAGSAGSNRPAEPTCLGFGPGSFCEGTSSCFYAPLGGGLEDLEAAKAFAILEYIEASKALPAGTKIPKGSVLKVKVCIPSTTGKVTRTPFFDAPAAPGTAGAPTAAQARAAVASLPFPRLTLAYSPGGPTTQGLTYVNTPTQWWVLGAGTGEIQSPSALGLVAHAKPHHLTIDPGDDTATVVCDWPTTYQEGSDDCTHTYEKSSINGTYTYLHNGKNVPAYQATATPTWTIWFTHNGATVPIPGAPTTQTATPTTANIPVAEIQSIVTGQG